MRYLVVETDNFGGDYPDEKFVTPPTTQEKAQSEADRRNAAGGEFASRYYKVVKQGYKLQPGFEP